MSREVTERDFRMPEFRDANPADYEFRRDDGKLVRKDRFERGMFRIAEALGMNLRDGFEVDAVVTTVEELTAKAAETESGGRGRTEHHGPQD